MTVSSNEVNVAAIEQIQNAFRSCHGADDNLVAIDDLVRVASWMSLMTPDEIRHLIRSEIPFTLVRNEGWSKPFGLGVTKGGVQFHYVKLRSTVR